MLLWLLEVPRRVLNMKLPMVAEFAEASHRKRLRDYSPIHDKSAGVIRPGREMRNFIFDQIDTAENVPPPYARTLRSIFDRYVKKV